MNASLGRVYKQPDETLYWDISFEEWCAARGVVPSTANGTAEPGVTASFQLIGYAVRVTVSGGTSGSKYKITILLTTAAPTVLVREADFTVVVKAI
jgi:hypothetical protein